MHTEKTMSFESFAGRVVRVLVERGADSMRLVVDLYRRRGRLLVSLRERLEQQTICGGAAVVLVSKSCLCLYSRGRRLA